MGNNVLNRTQRVLMCVFWSYIIITLFMAIAFETETLPTGVYATFKQTEFVISFGMELLTVCLIPLALRLFKFQKVHNDLLQRQETALMKWGQCRLAMLALPLFMNVLFYYLFMNTTFGYMGIILLLCMPFVYPSMNRCRAELE